MPSSASRSRQGVRRRLVLGQPAGGAAARRRPRRGRPRRRSRRRRRPGRGRARPGAQTQPAQRPRASGRRPAGRRRGRRPSRPSRAAAPAARSTPRTAPSAAATGRRPSCSAMSHLRCDVVARTNCPATRGGGARRHPSRDEGTGQDVPSSLDQRDRGDPVDGEGAVLPAALVVALQEAADQRHRLDDPLAAAALRVDVAQPHRQALAHRAGEQLQRARGGHARAPGGPASPRRAASAASPARISRTVAASVAGGQRPRAPGSGLAAGTAAGRAGPGRRAG